MNDAAQPAERQPCGDTVATKSEMQQYLRTLTPQLFGDLAAAL
jgi:hypothetical protein